MKKMYWFPLLCMTFSSLIEAQTPAPSAAPSPAAIPAPAPTTQPAAATLAGFKQQSFVLPINWTTTPKYSLAVTIPTGFKPIQPEFETMSSASLIEYIPENQDPSNWTEIVSVSKYIGQGIPAIKLVEEIKNKSLHRLPTDQCG